LGFITQEQGEGVALPGHAVETIGQGIVAILGAGDFDITDQSLGQGAEGGSVMVEGHVEAVGEDAGFEASGAEPGLLRESDQLDGEQFLGVDRLIGGDEVGSEISNLV
jgi:hypothetical protein